MQPQHLVKITFRSQLPREQALAIMRERMPAFAKLPGLIQKYYVETGQPNTYSGIYCWATKEHMDAYLKMPLRESIANAYQTDGEPTIEIFPVLATLR